MAMIKRLAHLLFSTPGILNILAIKLIARFGLGRYDQRLRIGAVERPSYGHCVYNGAVLAKKLGYQRVSVLEFGVAGGKGLLNLEYHALQTSNLLSVDIDIYGFDTGEGLPEPLDYRDLPYHWKKGFFSMDLSRLQSKLKKAKIVLGDVNTTINGFFEEYNPSPIAAIMFDLDFYSSTVASLKIFDADDKYFLPRIFCYFDDVVGSEIELYNDFTGMRLAIHEFNRSHESKKFGLAYYLLSRRLNQPWYYNIFIYHNFRHCRYNDFISEDNQQLFLD